MSISIRPFGEKAKLFTIAGASGASVSVTNYGGILQSVIVPDKGGKFGDVVLGCKEYADYAPVNDGFLGALVGRVGNRIAKGDAIIDGRHIALARNSNGHHLHGGNHGFNEKLWQYNTVDAENYLELTMESPDGEENYPGTLRVKVTYSWSDDMRLTIHYEATSDKDTLCNLTNHSYFNLDGEGSGSIEDHTLQIDADRVTVVDAELIPTGETRDVTGTPFDLRQPKRLGDGLKTVDTCEQMRFGGGYDHNFCLNGTGMRKIATLRAGKSGRKMDVFTDQPGVQFYSGNMLAKDMPGKCGRVYAPRDGLCLETQCWPDAVHHADFPQCLLKAGEKYDTTTVYAFSVE